MGEFWSDLFGFISVTGICILVCYIGYKILDYRHKKWEEKNPPKDMTQYWREKRWRDRAEVDKARLNANPLVKEQLEQAYESLLIVWTSANEAPKHKKVGDEIVSDAPLTEADKEYISETALRGLTPSFFLKFYESFKTKDKNAIKDVIYEEIPYFAIDLYIEMGVFIFDNNKNIYALNYIINSTDSTDNVTEEDRVKAKGILAEEEKNK